ncbi:MAG TPA: hypothetical protein VFQ44_05540 [Streptosporangiaceae bacterium]|nr:hypothetical protein [Streptosporangiaceae bacterium]
MSKPTERQYRTVLYGRPLVPGLNDTDEYLDQACSLVGSCSIGRPTRLVRW